jgi:predicted PurR-regulated permease PerM
VKKHEWKPYIAWGVTGFLTIIASILFFFFLYRLQDLTAFGRTISNIMRPIIIGAVLAYLLTPIYNWVRKQVTGLMGGGKRAVHFGSGAGILVSLIFLVAVAYALVAMIVPELISSITGIASNYDVYFQKVNDWIAAFLANNPDYRDYLESALWKVQDYVRDWVNNTLLPNISDYMAVVFNLSSGVMRVLVAIKDLAIGLIVAAYLLASKDLFCAQGKKILYSLLPLDHANLVIAKFRYTHQVFGGFINGKLLDSLIIGVLCFVGCSLMKMPYAMLVSVIVGVTNIVPFFGPFIGAIPSAILILLNSPIKCVYFIVFIFLIQQFDGNILGPKILGNSTGLSSFWVLFAILLFGGLFGFVGMIVGVPVFAVIYSLIEDLVCYGLKKRELSLDTNDYRDLASISEEGHRYRKIGEEDCPDGEETSHSDPQKPV